MFLYRQNQDNNQVWLQYGGSYHQTSGTVTLNSWVHVALQVVTAGSGASTVKVWLNGILVYETTTANLGTSGVLTMQIGNTAESVTVKAESAIVQTSSAEHAGEITTSQVDNLAIKGRNIVTLLQYEIECEDAAAKKAINAYQQRQT